MTRGKAYRREQRRKKVLKLFRWNSVWSWRNDPVGGLLDAKKRADNPKDCDHLECKNVRRANRHRKGPGLTKQELGNAASAKEDLENLSRPEDAE